MSFNLSRYWDGQPVLFVCCERRKLPDDEGSGSQDGGDPWGEFFWCVSIQPEEQEETAETPEAEESEYGQQASTLDID